MKIKTLDAIPRNQFRGFVIAIVISFITNADKLIGDWEEMFLNWIPDPLWQFILGFGGNLIILYLVVTFGIERPGINNFLSKLMEALRDGKLDPAEKLILINALKDEFLGQWADLSNMVYANKKEPDNEEKKGLNPELD